MENKISNPSQERITTILIPQLLTAEVIEKKTRTKDSSLEHLSEMYAFYLLIKSEAPGSGWIKLYTNQVAALSRKFGISEGSFYYYLNELERIKLAYREGDKIRIASWHELGNHLHIRIKIKLKYSRVNHMMLTKFLSQNKSPQ